MFGAPHSNSKIIKIIEDILELKIDKIEFRSDYPEEKSYYGGWR